MTSVLLLPGSWEGGWVYDDVAAELGGRGHTVSALTLPGLEGGASGGPTPNLDDHVAAVVGHLERQDLRDVVIAAHSYGGMVLRGVTDAVGDRCAGAIYIDAFLPEEGDSCFMLMGDVLREAVTSLVSRDGRYVQPLPDADPRSAPHPVASLLQASRAARPDPRIRHAYVFASGWRASPFKPVYSRVQEDPQWVTHAIDETHELMRYSPLQVADVIATILDDWALAPGEVRSAS